MSKCRLALVKVRYQKLNGTKMNVVQRFRDQMGECPEECFSGINILYEEWALEAEVHTVL